MEKVTDQGVVWTVGNRGDTPALPKLPYIPPQRQKEGMSEEQKQFVQLWNTMQKRLVALNQMETK